MKKPPKISEQDKQLFRQAMQGAKRLEQPHKVVAEKSMPKPRRKMAIKEPGLSLEEAPETHYRGDQTLFYARTGLQHKVIRHLRQGKLPIQARIDLHGLNIEQAKQQLEHFLSDCQQQGLRYLHIIHGKGDRREQASAIIKNKVYGWLSHHENILAFSSCQAKDGGTGALYVIVKSVR